jgi:hypothetical protein
MLHLMSKDPTDLVWLFLRIPDPRPLYHARQTDLLQSVYQMSRSVVRVQIAKSGVDRRGASRSDE